MSKRTLDPDRLSRLIGCPEGLCRLEIRPVAGTDLLCWRWEVLHVMPAHERTFTDQDGVVFTRQRFDQLNCLMPVDLASFQDGYVDRLEEAVAERIRHEHDRLMGYHA